MIVRRAADLRGTAIDVRSEHWSSLRLLVRDDGMGFTITDTHIEAGMDQVIEYKHHLEACYCLEGELTVEDLATGEIHEIGPGSLYALDRHDRHRVRARTRVRLICVFRPPLAGTEVHTADGSYESN